MKYNVGEKVIFITKDNEATTGQIFRYEYYRYKKDTYIISHEVAYEKDGKIINTKFICDEIEQKNVISLYDDKKKGKN